MQNEMIISRTNPIYETLLPTKLNVTKNGPKIVLY